MLFKMTFSNLGKFSWLSKARSRILLPERFRLITFFKQIVDNTCVYETGKPVLSNQTHDDFFDKEIKIDFEMFSIRVKFASSKVFFDHALIASLGLGSVINWPIILHKKILGTVNLLAEEGAYKYCDLFYLEKLTPWLTLAFVISKNIEDI